MLQVRLADRLHKHCQQDQEEFDSLCTSICHSAVQVHEATVEAGAYPSPLNYYNFPKSVCTSVNEVRSHGTQVSAIKQKHGQGDDAWSVLLITHVPA